MYRDSLGIYRESQGIYKDSLGIYVPLLYNYVIHQLFPICYCYQQKGSHEFPAPKRDVMRAIGSLDSLRRNQLEAIPIIPYMFPIFPLLKKRKG